MSSNGRHCLSKIFQPIINVSKTANLSHRDVTSKSQRLMLELGIIHQAIPGCFHFLPLGIKSLNKLVRIVDEEMSKIGGQKIRRSRPDLFHLKDRHSHDYILSPTHEEVASDLIARLAPLSYKNFPLRLYQMSNKYRDEMKPRFGLMRGREFLMKDMYSFDVDAESAMKTYEEVCQSYDNVFKRVGIDFVKVLVCRNCDYSANVELSGSNKCPNCEEQEKIDVQTGIEVGHTFLLGSKYSEPLKARFLAKNGKPEVLQMGSYGIGLSRTIAASVEVLSSEQEMGWPDSLAPYNVIILPPKSGSKEESTMKGVAEKLYSDLEAQIPSLKDNVLLDDRVSLTIGRRQVDARRVGYRYMIVINQKAAEHPPLFELYDAKENIRVYLSQNELFRYIKDYTMF
ncbi:hypothetical protein NQ318_012414 [Aromia moschata]|uniref:proline--tRNA ligase n=1 Tax=Aromia moschata TaxID=1265417 RepID=A0AAV8Y2Q6_9CUCU|nr:hypothetical protein NQ318_012414 [Aromia moschata]